MLASHSDMEIEADSRTISRVPVEGVVKLFETLTTCSFGATILREINAWTRVDHCALMRITSESEVQVFAAEHLPGCEQRGARAAVAYIDRYHRFDSNRRLVAHASCIGRRVVWRREQPRDVAHSDYRRISYEDCGIVDRLSFITGDERGGLVVLNLYRQQESGAFDDDDLATLVSIAPFFTAASGRHIGLLLHAGADPASWRQRLRVVRPDLTGRELDVTANLLAGQTLRQASEALGVAHSTVVTYRQRAYGRLGVKTLRELRSLFTAS